MTGMPNTRKRNTPETPARQADTARERRSKRAEQAQRKTQYATERPHRHTERPPAVSRRSSVYDMATPMHAASHIRRRIDIPIGATGGEFSLPSIPMIHFGWRAVSGILLVMLLVCAGMMIYSPAFKVESIEVEGLNRVPLAEVSQAAAVVDEAIYTIDPLKVQTALEEAFPDFSQIKIAIGLPATVKITVVERTPVLRWFNDSGEHWVDQEGFIFPARGDGSTLSLVEADILPGITEDMLAVIAGKRLMLGEDGITPMKIKLDPALVVTLVDLAKSVPEGSPLFYQPDRGFGWTDDHGWIVYFGANQTDLEQKQIVYTAIVNYLVRSGIKPAMVSVENPHAPYYRMER